MQPIEIQVIQLVSLGSEKVRIDEMETEKPQHIESLLKIFKGFWMWLNYEYLNFIHLFDSRNFLQPVHKNMIKITKK